MIDIYFKGKKVGIVENEIYRIIKKPEHFFKKYQGFGISVEVLLEKLKPLGVKFIEMIYLGSKGVIIYDFKYEEYLESKLEYIDIENDVQKFVKARGHERLINNEHK